MRELVAVDTRSLEVVEAFLADVAGRPLTLGRVWLSVGPVGWVVTSVSRASAVTIGRVIFLSRKQSREFDGDAVGRLGPLLVHECVHVWQYQENGFYGFMRKYLQCYFNELKTASSLRRSARRAAYFAIPFEAEAYYVEALWRDRSDSGDHPPRQPSARLGLAS